MNIGEALERANIFAVRYAKWYANIGDMPSEDIERIIKNIYSDFDKERQTDKARIAELEAKVKSRDIGAAKQATKYEEVIVKYSNIVDKYDGAVDEIIRLRAELNQTAYDAING